MKRIRIALSLIFLIALSLQAHTQVKDYAAEWKKIDELVQQRGLPQSALQEVRKIYARAKAEKQDAQVIKSLLYMTMLRENTREDNLPASIRELEKELQDLNEPAASITRSLLATRYWQYFQRYRWQLYNRTNTAGFDKSDIATWTAADFHKKIGALFLQSVEKEDLLKSTKLEAYDALLVKGNSRHLRPTLFDLLAHEALDYFRNTERDVARPAYAFEVEGTEPFAPAAAFSTYRFNTKDSLSLHYKALTIYQRLIAFHLANKRTDALLDVDISRLQFVHAHAVHPQKDSLYRAALQHIIQEYGGNAQANMAKYLLAAQLDAAAGNYDPLGDTTNRYLRVEARKILAALVRDSAVKNEGWIHGFNLLQEIDRPQLNFNVEKVNLPGQPFRALIQFRNIEGLHFRIVKATEALKKLMADDGGSQKFWEAFLKASPQRSWQQPLPHTGDLQLHRVEVKIDSLEDGDYVLMASNDSRFNTKSLLALQLFHISPIAYINRGSEYFILHRDQGRPLKGARADVYTQTYDYNARRQTKTKIGSYVTDENGRFIPGREKGRHYNGYFFDISHGDSRLFLNDLEYEYYYDNQEEPSKDETQLFYFLDRSIYRPGQTVYFKGIGVRKNKKENNVAAGYNTTIYLRNANYEIIDSLAVKANDFGSFSGRFTLPGSGLTGVFHLTEATGNNNTYFSVEAYKRPRFAVAFGGVDDAYKVNDTVTVKGDAKAYAGNAIEGATVTYRVVRRPRFIYFWRSWLPQVAPMEIAHGTTTTDSAGNFTVRFTAIPDLKIDRSLDPLFDYVVQADVTDINGETRSASTRITAGYKSLLLKLHAAARMPVDSLKSIFVRTENLNGKYMPAAVQLKINRLIPENRLIRDRYWVQPDLFIMNKETYISYFPHDMYRNEKDKRTWQKEAAGFTINDSTRIAGNLPLQGLKLQPGHYEITATTRDAQGNIVQDKLFIELYEPASRTLPAPEYLWAKGSEAAAPGATARIEIGTSAPDVFLIRHTEKEREKNEVVFTKLDRQKTGFTYKISESDRGGFGASFAFVKHNRLHHFEDVVNVPWTNKELDIEFVTFRDKTLPGSEEKWKVRISGHQNEKLAAEMLASMYDASLDQFRMHEWNIPSLWSTFSSSRQWKGGHNFADISSMERYVPGSTRSFEKRYDHFIWDAGEADIRLRGRSAGLNEVVVSGIRRQSAAPSAPVREESLMVQAQDADGNKDVADKLIDEGPATDTAAPAATPEAGVQVRRNLQETAFFFPQLHTDENGTIEFSFTAPEALTRWKLQTLAHTKDLSLGLSQKALLTQKELMVQPNMPRFLRQGDVMEIPVKIANLSEREMTGQVQLLLFDATTNQPVDGWFMNTFPNQYFTVAAGSSEVVQFPIQVPHQFNSALTWRIVARSGNTGDGEENLVPVLTNKVLVTETLPLPLRGNGTKNFRFDALAASGNSESLLHHALTVEFTSNPAWYAVQALPYLADKPKENAEQVWNRYYANALASHIARSAPRITDIFSRWKGSDTAALLSNLQKNEALKNILLEETPWVLQAKTEAAQKKNIALLFDLVRMNSELRASLAELQNFQSANGGFVWYKGGPDDRYMTQYIITGMGHLEKLAGKQSALQPFLSRALLYLDSRIKEDYDQLIKDKADLTKPHVGYLQVQYLYMRSFFPQLPVAAASKKAFDYYKGQATQFWIKGNKYTQAMTALALHRYKDVKTPAAILRSLKESSITHEELGMYWKDNAFGAGWFWWQAPIETQALMIEAFADITKDDVAVANMKTWLIKHKQTNHWRTSKATADACYAMLLQGPSWLEQTPSVEIRLGNTVMTNNDKSESGTGYFKQSLEGRQVAPQMGAVRVTVSGAAPAAPSWGAVYWQYFEDMDAVKSAATPLQLKKQLFVESNTDRGPVLTPVADGSTLAAGQKLKVRIELRVDRDMEYVHMKDMRAASLEPVNVLSGYRWQGGLGYYESTGDAATNFFFGSLRRGTYVFEYPLFVAHKGRFSNGITTIQSLYAPEFTAHSEGVRINVE